MLSCRIRIFGAFDSLRRELECPGYNQRDRKTERGQKNNKPNHPIRNFQERKDLRCDLNQKPADDSIRDRHLVNIASFCLAEEFLRIHRRSLELTKLLYRPGQDSGNKRFETRIATQGIEKRFDLDEVDIETVVIASRLFQPIQRMIVFAKRQINDGKSVCWHVARLRLFGELAQYLP